MTKKKSKEQIIDAYETRLLLKVLSFAVLITGLISAKVLPAGSGYDPGTIVLVAGSLISGILMLIALRCPICDRMNSSQYLEVGSVGFRTGFYRCNECNLSNRQIGEYVDLLKRGVEIDKNVIARFNKREL